MELSPSILFKSEILTVKLCVLFFQKSFALMCGTKYFNIIYPKLIKNIYLATAYMWKYMPYIVINIVDNRNIFILLNVLINLFFYSFYFNFYLYSVL
ncbi:hypothetical protein Catovirus_1_775 [Catovirus CTV1]|uniref:Uncharacterized protein n=1 Tax=Catovirus CTV1 TaxID=1977631 RepID=A0A1V0SAH8_9VIRU|nr:hypothetical protein Catovirus_1_775 [Catovirus CTV1]